jgi:hypothetical protein
MSTKSGISGAKTLLGLTSSVSYSGLLRPSLAFSAHWLVDMVAEFQLSEILATSLGKG